MKTINQTKGTPISHALTTVTDLRETTELTEDSLLHIVHCEGGGKYESMKMTVDNFKQKIYEAVQNTFKTEYWDTHEKGSSTHGNDETEDGTVSRPVGSSFKEMLEYLDEDAPSVKDSSARFIDHLYYDFDVLKRYVVKKDGYLTDRLNTVDSNFDELNCLFASNMNITNDTDITENNDNVEMSIAQGNKISNTWRCEATGNLVVYGWLDSSDALNNKSTPSCYCAIEANINATSDGENWKVIAVQPVAPFKNITYVGFNIPVKKGLVIRARTGFTVGAKSGQSSNAQDGYDTLSNSTPNGFRCVIYSNSDYKDQSSN